VAIMHAKFQPSSFNGVGEEGGDRRNDGQRKDVTLFLAQSLHKNSKLFWENINLPNNVSPFVG